MIPTQHTIFDEFQAQAKETEKKDGKLILIKDKSKRTTTSNPIKSFDEVRTDVVDKAISLRKQDKDKKFENRRRFQTTNIDYTTSVKEKLTVDLVLYQQCNDMRVSASDLNQFVQKFRSQNLQDQYVGIVGLRKITSLAVDPPIQEIIDLGLVYDIIMYLDHGLPEFQLEALWILTNIASGESEHVNSIIQKGGIPKITNLIDSKIAEIQEQAIWAIGNISGHGVKIRDRCIQSKALEKIINYYLTAERPELVKQCTWSISNFCRSKPVPDYETLRNVLDVIFKNMKRFPDDKDFLIDAFWIISYISENHKKTINTIIDSNILPDIIKALNIEVVKIQLPCLRIIGNICSGNAKQTQKVVDSGVLNFLSKTIFHTKKSIRKETCWILSNIAAGTQEQINTLIELNFLPILTQVIKTDEIEIKKEAIWAACNLTSTESKHHAEIILNQNILELIKMCLGIDDAKYIAVSLEALGNLLQYGKTMFNDNGINLVKRKVEELGMADILEQLLYHPVEIVYEKALRIIETYFETVNES